MCGIVGWLGNRSRREPDELVHAADMIRHRGPDDRGTFWDDRHGMALAHNRLSIIDLSPAGRQPMFSRDEQSVLVFNGEIYNFQELRHELTQLGHHFESRSDSEVLLRGYEQWGTEVLDRLQGMFAFAIWDARRRQLFLARDPMGIKPLYYWWSPAGDFVFASEIKAFLALEEFDARPNIRMLRQFLEMNFIYDLHETSLQGVFKLPAGHTLAVSSEDVRKKQCPVPQRFYYPPGVDDAEAESTGESPVVRLHDVLQKVVREHLIADVPVGLLLSGGLDSSLLAAMAAREQPIRTVSMGFADSALDERSHARAAAEWIGSEHEEVLIHPQEISDSLADAVWYVDDLFGDWGVISTRLLYQKCRATGIKVVLVGEGSDELFAGYPNYVTSAGPATDAQSFSRRALSLYRWYSGRRWGGELWRFHQTVQGLYQESDGDFFSTVRLFETRHQLPHCYNMKVDKASMSVSVEARVPFLDVRIANEGYRAARSQLLNGNTNKWLLRQVALTDNLLPPHIANRPKVGGSIGADWMDNSPHFRDFARDVILDRDGFTETLGLTKAMRAYFDYGQQGYGLPSGLSIFSMVAWRLLMLNLWARHYLHAKPRPPSVLVQTVGVVG